MSSNVLPGNMQAPVFLMGATATGKTALSIALAKALNAEIISVDSALVYRGMDIGTAKPTMAERDGVTHHLIDVCNPWESYSAAQFCQEAVDLMASIESRGKRALLVGGTMLYFKALEEGLADLPDADAALRQALVSEAEQIGWQGLHARLARIDPRAADRIHPNDPQRIQRALEVYTLTGVSMSEQLDATQSPLPVAPIKFALAPLDRAWLHSRIQRRFDLMLEADFLEEVKALRCDDRIHSELPAIRSVGYRQAWEYLEQMSSAKTLGATASDTQWVDRAVAATRQLAKRQLTWLRGMKNVHPIQCDLLSMPQQQALIWQSLSEIEKSTT